MIDIHIPASLEYNTTNASLLATTLKTLRSFDEIAEWDKKAMAEVEALHSILKAIEGKQQTAIQVISQERHEQKRLNYQSIDLCCFVTWPNIVSIGQQLCCLRPQRISRIGAIIEK